MKFAGALLVTCGVLAIMFTIRKPPGGQVGSIPNPTGVGQTIVGAASLHTTPTGSG